LNTPATRRAAQLAETPVEEMTPGDIAFCLRQSLRHDEVIAVAFNLLTHQSLFEAELYPGDLLNALIHVSETGTLSAEQKNALWDICSDALAGADSIRKNVVPNIQSYMT
jgi:hypothetical protein